ncbi:DUF3987 domain-containing protein [Undibacterium sp. RTI2.1]|uniref:DUF3987 domain-containing protein n=1 Tax=unclassified Undibacterium TaxID=2630295 RepID=UPI002B2255EF|nr:MULTISPECIES: DUF3987 domain-containing protein [unclassified Undibacterium]MEB0030193.1 DUF3987 domain-containing protein [Undibacterium sp. RTI2.1]MEB0116817.1 DUF3987 domain-containing protein [Undibacterium sp. RTI2.2]
MPIIEYENGSAAYQPPAYQGIYPTDSFPALLREPILETSAIHRTPVELAAHAALGVASLACQHFVNVQCPSYDPAPVSLFLMGVSKTSGGKSVVEQRYLRGVLAFERKQKAEVAVMMSKFRAEMKIWEDDGRRLAREYRDATPDSVGSVAIRAKRLQHEKECPIEPKEWELRYGDMTPQGLRDALVANHAVGILSPEAGPALLGLPLSQPAILSGYWSGEDRPAGLVGGNRRPVDPRLTMSLTTQDKQFTLYMKNRGADAFSTGLLARFLVAFPKTFERFDQQTQIDDLPEPMLDKFNLRVAEILNQPLLAPDKRTTLKLSSTAKQYWKSFKEAVQKNLICGSFSEDLKSFFRKIGQQAARLAALFHYFDGAVGDISSDAMRGAIALCEWYLWECIRIFAPYAPSEQQQDAEAEKKLLQWLQEATVEPWRYLKLTRGRYTERDLRNYANFRGNTKVLEKAITTLTRQGSIAVRIGPKGGRTIFYPAWTAPNPAYVKPAFDSPPIHSNFNVPFNGVANMTEHNTIFPSPSSRLHFAVPLHGTLNQCVQEVPHPVNTTNPTSSSKAIDCDSEQMRAVKQHIEKIATEAGIGPTEFTVRFSSS